MGKLHELLAVEPDTENAYKKIFQETITTFTKKPDHFLAFLRTLNMVDDSRKHEEAASKEQKEMVTTVKAKLNHFEEFAAEYIDVIFQKESTNRSATADVTLPDGTVLFQDAPVTFLLALEKRLGKIRSVYESIPTIAPGIKWEKDTHLDVYKAVNDEVTNKTEKIAKSKILVEPTEHHPAQIEKWFEDQVVGTFRKQFWSGMLSPKEKSTIIGKIDTLSKAVKQARMRANNIDVKGENISDKIFGYIHS